MYERRTGGFYEQFKKIQALQLQSEKVFDYFEEICAIPHTVRGTQRPSVIIWLLFAKKA